MDSIVILTSTAPRYKLLAALAVADLDEPQAAGVVAAVQKSGFFRFLKNLTFIYSKFSV